MAISDCLLSSGQMLRMTHFLTTSLSINLEVLLARSIILLLISLRLIFSPLAPRNILRILYCSGVISCGLRMLDCMRCIQDVVYRRLIISL